MTTADRSQPPRLGRERFSGAAPDELTRLQGRNLGDCAACGRPVFFERNFTRFRGRVVHVRCPITTRTAPPMVPTAPVARDG